VLHVPPLRKSRSASDIRSNIVVTAGSTEGEGLGDWAAAGWTPKFSNRASQWIITLVYRRFLRRIGVVSYAEVLIGLSIRNDY